MICEAGNEQVAYYALPSAARAPYRGEYIEYWAFVPHPLPPTLDWSDSRLG